MAPPWRRNKFGDSSLDSIFPIHAGRWFLFFRTPLARSQEVPTQPHRFAPHPSVGVGLSDDDEPGAKGGDPTQPVSIRPSQTGPRRWALARSRNAARAAARSTMGGG
jgi:hypothetical protein